MHRLQDSDLEDRHGNLINGEWRQQLDTSSSGLHTITHVAGNRFTKSASELRDTLNDYFNSTEGAIYTLARATCSINLSNIYY